MTLLATTVRTARTRKRCLLCFGDIRPGQRYNDGRFAADGAAYAWPTHCFCLWLAGKLELHDPCFDELAQGAVYENWSMCVTQPWDDPLHELATVIGWWAQWMQEAP